MAIVRLCACPRRRPPPPHRHPHTPPQPTHPHTHTHPNPPPTPAPSAVRVLLQRRCVFVDFAEASAAARAMRALHGKALPQLSGGVGCRQDGRAKWAAWWQAAAGTERLLPR